MAPSLKNLSYEEKLSRLKLSTLEKTREKGDIISVYRVSKRLKKIDKEDLFVWDDINIRGHEIKQMRHKKTAENHNTFNYVYTNNLNIHGLPLRNPEGRAEKNNNSTDYDIIA